MEECMRAIAIFVTLTAVLGGCKSSGGNPEDTSTEEIAEVVDTVEVAGDPDAEIMGEVECSLDSDCDDSDSCTTDSCDAGSGDCVHGPVDEDDDGFPAAVVDSTDCGGTDCDDMDDEIYPGSSLRICGQDADCNGYVDADNDGDGHEREDCDGDDCEDELTAVNPSQAPGCGADLLDPLSDLDCNGNADADNDDDGHVSEVCASGDDCDDSQPTIHPEALEVCLDGIDQDCDGSVDGPLVAGSMAVVNGPSYPGKNAAMAFSGSRFGVVWKENNSVLFRTLDGDGSPLVSAVEVWSVASDSRPDITWSGSEFGIIYDMYSGGSEFILYFARVSSEGAVLISHASVSSASAIAAWDKSIVWASSGYGIVWADYRGGVYRVYYAHVSPAGSPDLTETQLGSNMTLRAPDMAWSGSEFGVVWADRQYGEDEIVFVRLTEAGAYIGSEVRVTDAAGTSTGPSIAWTGSDWGLAWMDERDGVQEIYFTTLDTSGVSAIQTRVTNVPQSSVEPSLAWTGSEFGLMWEDHRLGTTSAWDGYLALVQHDGTVSDEQNATLTPMDSSSPDLVWTSSELAYVWYEDGFAAPNVFFNRVTLCQ
jgi:hypothetical protein